MKRTCLVLTIGIIFTFAIQAVAQIDHLVFEPPGKITNGKHVVLISGDEEYRSEESCPMLAKILSQRHGFKCTVLFAIDKATGYINPNEISNIPNTQALATADLMIIGTRWRKLPSEQLQPILDYLNAAKPIIAFRTATHAFNNNDHYGGYDWQNFGRAVVGENWLSHHGRHKVQGGRAIVVEEHANHPVMNGVADIFTPSDIYGIEYLDQKKATVLLRGAVTETLDPSSLPVTGKKNDPMMPLAWLKDYPSPDGARTGQCFATTAGAAVDLRWEDLRRLFVNAAFHLTGLVVPNKANVDPVDPYEPSFYGFQAKDYFIRRGLRVSDFKLGSSAKVILSESELRKVESKRASATGYLPKPERSERIILLGNGLGERMIQYGFFETELQLRFPDQQLVIRNMSRPAYTPAFRPHPARHSQWAFPDAEKLRPEFKIHSGIGHFPSPDQWLETLRADTILAFFGFNESFDGYEGLDKYRAELEAFVQHTLNQKYNGVSAPRLVLISPIAFQDLSTNLDLPNGHKENTNLALYSGLMQEIADKYGLHFIDLFATTTEWFGQGDTQLTINGAHLNEAGYQKLAPALANALYGPGIPTPTGLRAKVHLAIKDKNWYWFNDYQMLNSIHSYGRRWKPFGNVNYPEEIEKLRELTGIRDQAIWAALKGETIDITSADKKTRPLTPIKTNAEKRRQNYYQYGDDALARFTMAEGYKIELFASEREFPELANPCQLSFDNRGRLWVSTMPSYPHFRPGDPRPDDKLLILEDNDNDGKADKSTVFADGLHVPVGFEFAPEGVYVSQSPNLLLLRDTDGDDKADSQEIMLTGFDSHDTHHAISAFCADPSGAFMMCEGLFHHTNVESAYGAIRGVNGGFFRYSPQRQHLERTVQTNIPNPWGVAFDEWGQAFFLITSGPDMYWMLPVEVKARYGVSTRRTENLIQKDHRVRPTSGLEFVSSRHFPDEVQGDYILNNSIGFLGAKQHTLDDAGTGYVSRHRHDLFRSSDPNFRPVDLEFAPDGSLYVVDWHNQLIGHMQHSARDPLRDHAHGRIYRITYPSRPLVKPAKVAGATIERLLENLKLPEYRSRYRSRRELRAHSADKVATAVKRWTAALDRNDPDYERYLLEGLWVTWGMNQVDIDLLRRLLQAKSYKARAAAVRTLRYNIRDFDDHVALLTKAANDEHSRVRLEAIIAGSWLDNHDGLKIIETAGQKPIDRWMENAYKTAMTNLSGKEPEEEFSESDAPSHLSADAKALWTKGAEIYQRDGHCITCHQPDGKGLPASGFPPLDSTQWVNGNAERLIKITLNGLHGPIEVKGKKYPGFVPMTQFRGLLDDHEIAAVLTYVRNSFNNKASAITPDLVGSVRESTKHKAGFWSPADFRN
ncbi:MAG: Cytochrome c-552 [Verrucomicrobia subdivision 3 bacterium]|nr:Cytochrome c-552 [Limisphaerales bacterium]MCS1414052.1 Cytochrome c-552 [Limisphaerales bacterium]